MIAQRLRDLDNRVLGYDKRMARLRTEEGWRKNVSRWRWLLAGAVVEISVGLLSGRFDDSPLLVFVGMGAVMAFQAGMLKAEDDRLHRRGMYRYLPPGV
ncbi:MAG: hypothetical protein QOI82_793 [Actinomycetota bacterium]|jgi:hypothetical protein|nr:hypothetical protein [Actinomycetota bacterium]